MCQGLPRYDKVDVKSKIEAGAGNPTYSQVPHGTGIFTYLHLLVGGFNPSEKY